MLDNEELRIVVMRAVVLVLRMELEGEETGLLRFVPVGLRQFLSARAGVDALQKRQIGVADRNQGEGIGEFQRIEVATRFSGFHVNTAS